MAFIGRLAGGVDSRLTNIVLAYALSSIHEQTSSDSLVFAEDVQVEVERAALNKLVDDTIVFDQEASAITVREFFASVEDELVFEQSATGGGPVYVSVGHTLNFVQDEEGRRGVANVFATDTIAFTQRVGRTLSVDVDQTLNLTDDGERRNIILHNLGLLQQIVVGKGPMASDVLNLQQTATRNAILNRTIAQPLGIIQSLTYYVIRPCTYQQYTPFVGATGDTDYPPPTQIVPTLGTATLTLTYPYVGPTQTLVLRNPAFQDRDRLSFSRINRETRGGTLILFSDPKWPKTQTLVLQVDGLKQSQVAELLTFLEDSLGQEIGLLDWEGRSWRGIIVNPDTPITHVSRQDRSVELQFQGELD